MKDKIEKEIEYWEMMLKEDAEEYERTHYSFWMGRISATKQFIRKLKIILHSIQLEEGSNG